MQKSPYKDSMSPMPLVGELDLTWLQFTSFLMVCSQLSSWLEVGLETEGLEMDLGVRLPFYSVAITALSEMSSYLKLL